jgi:excisionase family DNA binding protein
MFAIPRFEVEFTPSTRILRGLDEIAAYLKVHRRTTWRWIRDYGLPAMQAPSGTWFTSTSLVDLWIIAASKAQRQARTGKAPGADPDYGDIETF